MEKVRLTEISYIINVLIGLFLNSLHNTGDEVIALVIAAARKFLESFLTH